MSESKLSIVDTRTSHKLAGTTQPFILNLNRGENLFEGILNCAERIGLHAASLSGLGALEDPSVAFYHLDTKQYDTTLFKGIFELVSLHGNISFVDNKHFAHIHAALGRADHSLFGGHLMDGRVGVVAEITIIPLASRIERHFVEQVGLKVLGCPI
jgi:predicted DNA-binding protein with PD1-like motif